MNNSLKLLLMLPLLIAQTAWSAPDPVEQVREVSSQVLDQVMSRKAELLADPSKIYNLVEDSVLQQFDFERMSRLVLGKNWNRASEEQKSAFTREFRELLVRSYATALLSYSGEEIVYKPLRDGETGDDVEVETLVSAAGAVPIPIDYRLYLDGEHWRVYDVAIDGVSLLLNYRSNFASQIRRVRLEGLIAKLRAHNNREP